jgi:Zn finger protein HypA/HybF involved in hydrogenase expression
MKFACLSCGHKFYLDLDETHACPKCGEVDLLEPSAEADLLDKGETDGSV